MIEGRTRIGSSGRVSRVEDGFIVQIKNQPWLLDIPGVRCDNPDAPETERVYSKSFLQKKIYMPNQATQARKEVLGGKDALVIGMTGYSSLSDEQCHNWGIQPGAYENACMDILGTSITELRREYPGIRPKIVHGASNMGVDKAVISVARELNLDHLGHSCPEFLFYVEDDDDPVHVAVSRDTYSDEFIKSLNILLSVGGRVQALEHDISAAIRFDKHVILLNVLRSLSSNGNPPARDASGKVVDATAAFEDAIAMMSGQTINRPYTDIREFATRTSGEMARKQLSPATSFGRWRRDL